MLSNAGGSVSVQDLSKVIRGRFQLQTSPTFVQLSADTRGSPIGSSIRPARGGRRGSRVTVGFAVAGGADGRPATGGRSQPSPYIWGPGLSGCRRTGGSPGEAASRHGDG